MVKAKMNEMTETERTEALIKVVKEENNENMLKWMLKTYEDEQIRKAVKERLYILNK